MTHRPDVLVVGAGPAGLVAAGALAGRGLRVLVVGPEPTGADHDLLIGAAALSGLRALGVPLALARPADGIELAFGDGPARTLRDAELAVISRSDLLTALADHATSAGAQRLAGTVGAVRASPEGFQAVLENGTADTVTARHVIIAAGAAPGSLGRPVAPHALGTAWARRFSGAGLPDLMTQTLLAPTGPASAPACLWSLPRPDGTVTLGAVEMAGGGPIDLDRIAAVARSWRTAVPVGPAVTGTLNTGFSPQRVAATTGLPIGDAAGLTNPFTGEGISHAVQSAMLAADAISRYPADSAAAAVDYTARLTATFVGYFETARHAARRYHLMWRVLESGADSDHPFFAKARRAMLMSDGLAAITATERIELPAPAAIAMKPFLIATDEVAITTVREEWPFLARLLITSDDHAHRRLRPAALFYAALMADGTPPPIRYATPAAALELAMLGALAFLSPPAGRAPDRGIDWARAATVLAGDFLFAQASRLIADSVPEMSWSFADWLAELTAVRAARLAHGDAEPAESVFASLLEYPVRIGAELGGAGAEVTDHLRAFGNSCGRAFLHAEDVLAVQGVRTRLDTTAAAMAQSRLSALPADLANDPALREAAVARAATACRSAWAAAVGELDVLGGSTAAVLLRGFADAVAAPAGSLPGHGVGEKAPIPFGVPKPVGPS